MIDVKDPYRRSLLRLWANYRRRVSSQEVRELVVEMAEELRRQGYKPGEIAGKLAQETPYTERWIQQILPSEYKLEHLGAKASTEKNIPPKYFADLSVSSGEPQEASPILSAPVLGGEEEAVNQAQTPAPYTLVLRFLTP